MARDGLLVLSAVLVGLLNLVAGVTEVDVVALLSAEFLLTGGLYAGHSGVVSASVFVRVPVNVSLIYLGDISQEVPAGVEGVVPHASHLALETRETVFYLVKAHIRLGRDHSHHSHGLEADCATAALVFLEFSPNEFRRNVKHGSEGHRIKSLDLTRAHKYVIRHLVTHQDIPVTVIDDAAGGVNCLIDGGIAVCVLLIAVYDLQ